VERLWSGGVEYKALQPRLSAEALEDGSGLGEERLGLLGVSFLGQPLGMLEEGDGQPEGDSEFA
jgi:hypothetical protein